MPGYLVKTSFFVAEITNDEELIHLAQVETIQRDTKIRVLPDKTWIDACKLPILEGIFGDEPEQDAGEETKIDPKVVAKPAPEPKKPPRLETVVDANPYFFQEMAEYAAKRDREAAQQERQKAEEEAKIKAEEEAKLKAEEEARQKAEEAKLKAEEEAKIKAEEEARQKAEASPKNGDEKLDLASLEADLASPEVAKWLEKGKNKSDNTDFVEKKDHKSEDNDVRPGSYQSVSADYVLSSEEEVIELNEIAKPSGDISFSIIQGMDSVSSTWELGNGLSMKDLSYGAFHGVRQVEAGHSSSVSVSAETNRIEETKVLGGLSVFDKEPVKADVDDKKSEKGRRELQKSIDESKIVEELRRSMKGAESDGMESKPGDEPKLAEASQQVKKEPEQAESVSAAVDEPKNSEEKKPLLNSVGVTEDTANLNLGTGLGANDQKRDGEFLHEDKSVGKADELFEKLRSLSSDGVKEASPEEATYVIDANFVAKRNLKGTEAFPGGDASEFASIEIPLEPDSTSSVVPTLNGGVRVSDEPVPLDHQSMLQRLEEIRLLEEEQIRYDEECESKRELTSRFGTNALLPSVEIQKVEVESEEADKESETLKDVEEVVETLGCFGVSNEGDTALSKDIGSEKPDIVMPLKTLHGIAPMSSRRADERRQKARVRPFEQAKIEDAVTEPFVHDLSDKVSADLCSKAQAITEAPVVMNREEASLLPGEIAEDADSMQTRARFRMRRTGNRASVERRQELLHHEEKDSLLEDDLTAALGESDATVSDAKPEMIRPTHTSQEIVAAYAAVEAARKAAASGSSINETILERTQALLEALEAAQTAEGGSFVQTKTKKRVQDDDEDENPSEVFKIRKRSDLDSAWYSEKDPGLTETSPTLRNPIDSSTRSRDSLSIIEQEGNSERFKIRNRNELRRLLLDESEESAGASQKSGQSELHRLFAKEDELNLLLANEIREKESDAIRKEPGLVNKPDDSSSDSPKQNSVTEGMPKRNNGVVAVPRKRPVEATRIVNSKRRKREITFDDVFFENKFIENEVGIAKFDALYLTNMRIWRVEGYTSDKISYEMHDLEQIQALGIHEESRRQFMIMDLALIGVSGILWGVFRTVLGVSNGQYIFLALLIFGVIMLPICYILSFRKCVTISCANNHELRSRCAVTKDNSTKAGEFLNKVDAVRHERKSLTKK